MQVHFILRIGSTHAFIIPRRHRSGVFNRQNIDLIPIRNMQMCNIVKTLLRIQLIVAAYDKTHFFILDTPGHIAISPFIILSLMICRTFSLSIFPQYITANNSCRDTWLTIRNWLKASRLSSMMSNSILLR